ncbi:MAG: hypothetical protein KDA20_04505 [Phycisphaerales bacterium]|nr:hypothetical protein [Phycisphaerales bacterium]
MTFKLHNFEDEDDQRPRGRGDGTVGGWRTRWPANLVENWDNPLGWSVKVGRAFGIDVRIHLATVLFMVLYVVSSISNFSMRGWMDLAFSALTMFALFMIVLLHEFGHCFACRWVGGGADRIVMLPFGGLALVQPPDTWKGNLITTIGGPAVNVLLIPVFAGAMLALGLGDQILFHPFMPSAAAAAIQGGSNWATTGLVALFWAHYVNFVILAFNVLLPMFPLDGGRMLQAILWRNVGYKRSMELAVNTGLIGAVGLCIFAVVWSQSMLMAIAIFAGLTCWMERQRVKAIDELTGFVPSDPIAGLATGRTGYGHGSGGASPAARKREAREAKDQEEMDRILDKISREGMGSITRAERKLLDRMSKTRRDV